MARNKEGKQPLCPYSSGLDIFNEIGRAHV